MRAAETKDAANARPSLRGCRRIEVWGRVQGVGFRPFVYRLARDLSLDGYVSNTSAGVVIEIEGAPQDVDCFQERLTRDCPALAEIDRLEIVDLPCAARSGFSIHDSERGGVMRSRVLPDIATCAACLSELYDPTDRRYQYPFTNCTHCGPRYSIIQAMPYDRPYTTMANFAMCDDCRAEYENPLDRRFHAQPIACPKCGPQLSLWSTDGSVLAQRSQALAGAVEALRDGKIVALKGLGGFQLLVDARSDAAVSALRTRKNREAKPFALMAPSLAHIEAIGIVEPAHAAVLHSSEAPITLIAARAESQSLIRSVAPDTYQLGVMLPYTPLHHLLLGAFNGLLVVTSGNRGDEPICIDEHEALDRLGDIADLFLVHDRPIARQVDDSIITIIHEEPMIMRRARGYAPDPLPFHGGTSDALAVGAHLKNSIAYTKDGVSYPGQHIGNLENLPALKAFQRTIGSMRDLFEFAPARVVHDLHPDYASTRYAVEQALPATGIQHHYAHVLSCMAEHGLEGPVLGVAWDGTGYGADGTIWGGEFLACTREGFTRLGCLRPFRLPGGDAAVRDGRRPALSLLHEVYGDRLTALAGLPSLEALGAGERGIFLGMIQRQFNAPLTTSMGRLFDAVASLCGLCQRSAFEGQAAMRLEREAVAWEDAEAPMHFEVRHENALLILDWRPVVGAIVAAVQAGAAVGAIAKGFHRALAEGLSKLANQTALESIVLTGGCFQNKRLLELTAYELTKMNYQVYLHRRVPPNDGGIAAGQAWYRPESERESCV